MSGFNFDLVNGLFELTAGCCNALNIVRIREDREIKGVHWFPYTLFSLWGVYNLFYYPHLGQTLSFAGGCVMVLVNVVWLWHWAYYTVEKMLDRAVDPLEDIWPRKK